MVRAAGPGQGWLGSIRVRILAVVVGLLVLSSIGSVLVLRTLLLQQLDAEIEERLDREAEEFALLSDGTDPQTGEPFDGDLRAILDVYFSREIPDEGESLLSFVDGRLYEASRSQDAAAVGELRPAIDYWMSLTEPERGSVDTVLGEARYVAVPLRGDGADGLFVVANFPSSEQAEINAAVQQHVLAQLGTLVVASLLGLALAGRVLRPLSALAATARRISDTDLSRRIPAAGRDEASQIAGAFNDMLARLEGAFTTQRRFLDDTSHELRTPSPWYAGTSSCSSSTGPRTTVGRPSPWSWTSSTGWAGWSTRCSSSHARSSRTSCSWSRWTCASSLSTSSARRPRWRRATGRCTRRVRSKPRAIPSG